ncbi:hypothetical protein AVW16_07545 [Crenobacter luteus]|uniref:Uncharacterized protein n=2 Tax=Crenobacter luteus TaxID=1452487 RepID=A0A163D5J3_9NEIS|nr:hypothetical protein AVW16_07545 [Crenobacter luteus]
MQVYVLDTSLLFWVAFPFLLVLAVVVSLKDYVLKQKRVLQFFKVKYLAVLIGTALMSVVAPANAKGQRIKFVDAMEECAVRYDAAGQH